MKRNLISLVILLALVATLVWPQRSPRVQLFPSTLVQGDQVAVIESLKRAGFDAELGEGVLIRKDQRVEAMHLLIQEQLPKGDISICACGGHRPEDPNDSNRDINGDLEAAVGMLPNVSKATISLKMEYFKKADFHLTIDTVDGGPLAQEEIAGIENLFRAYLLPKDDLVIHYTNLRNR